MSQLPNTGAPPIDEASGSTIPSRLSPAKPQGPLEAQSGLPSSKQSAEQPSPIRLLIYRYPLVFFVSAWIAGIGVANLGIGLRTSACLAITCGLSAAGLIHLNQARYWMKTAAALTAVAFTSSWYSLSHPLPDQDSLSALAKRQSQPIALRGVIREAAVWSPNPYFREHDPNSQPWNTKWLVCWEEIRDESIWKPVISRSQLLTAGRVHDFLPGDRIEVFGSFERIVPPTNPGMPDFSYRSQMEGIFVSVRVDDGDHISKLASTNKYWLDRLRGRAIGWIDDSLRRHITFDQAPLAAALIFGQREQVDWNSQQQLMATGTLHMLAISGMHIEMIAATLLVVCQFLNLRTVLTALILVGSCSAYAILAGANPPVVRALILIIAFTSGRLLGFHPRLFNLLALAALMLLIQSPYHLENVGVQLSFLAVATIGVFNRDLLTPRRSALQSLIEESLPKWRQWMLALSRKSLAGLKLSFWIGLLTCPLIWHHFHVVSVVSVPLNVILSIPLMIGLLAGLLTALLSWIPLVGAVLGAVSGTCLALISLLVNFFYSIPGGHLWLPSPQLWWSLIFVCIVSVGLVFRWAQQQWWLGVGLVCWTTFGLGMQAGGPRGFSGLAVSPSSSASPELRCTFIDVGHGTSVAIELPDGRVWLYDAGHMGAGERNHQVIASTLWNLRTARIDSLLISHADSDHYNATTGLLQRFQVGRVISTSRFWESAAGEAVQVRKLLDSLSLPRETWDSATPLQDLGAVNVQALHPPPAFRAETDNADSLCLQVEFAGIRILLPGDVEGSGLVTLCDQTPRHCQVMMAPHHGSLAHDVSGLLAWCRPNLVVISGNHRANRPEVLQRFMAAEHLGITFVDGAIQIRVTADGTLNFVRWSDDRWVDL
jgi:competence protein ComEC